MNGRAYRIHLRRNDPLDLDRLAAMLSDRDDLHLVWPKARFPFDPEQWRSKLSEHPSNRSYFILLDDEAIGHAALLGSKEPGVLVVAYLYIQPSSRGHGLGRALMASLEQEAVAQLGARILRLSVRRYNPRAVHVYAGAGFEVAERSGTLLRMRKALRPAEDR